MAGLVPAIHVYRLCDVAKTWMPGTKPGMTNYYCVRRTPVNFHCDSSSMA
jgi:hypothetical protein